MIKDIMFAQKYMKDNEEKTAWKKVGTMFIKDDGKMSIKIDMMPVGEFDGWCQVFDQKPRDNAPIPEEGSDAF